MNIEQRFKNQFAIPVIRQQNADKLYSLCRALIDGGLTILEVTLMSEAAYSVITKLSQDQGLLIGAGTVLNPEHAKRAHQAGAKFLVSPGLDEASVLYAQKNNLPFVPGVLTPSEVIRAQNLGLEMVKVFPISSVGGINYIKNLQGPFPQMKWMATGGVNVDDIRKYKEAGVTCVGLGGNLTPAKEIDAGNWQAITNLAKEVALVSK